MFYFQEVQPIEAANCIDKGFLVAVGLRSQEQKGARSTAAPDEFSFFSWIVSGRADG